MMAGEAALSSPFGNGPSNVNTPIPNGGPQNPPAAMPTQMGAAPPSPTPGSQPPGQPAPNPFDAELQKVQKGQNKGANPFLEMDPNLPLGYTPLTAKLRRAPDGHIDHLKNDGQWAPFGDDENQFAAELMGHLNNFAVRSKEDLPRVIGAIAGTAIAERVGLGPWAAAFMAGGSQAAAGAAADIAQGKSPTAMGVGADMAIGGATSLIPAKIGEYLGKKAAVSGVEAAVNPLIKQGGQELIDRQAQELATAQAIGAKPGPTVTQQDLAAVQRMGPEAQKLYQMNWGKAAQLRETFGNAVSKLMGNQPGQELGVEDPNYFKIIGNVMKSTGETTTKLKGLAKEVSGDAIHDIDPVMSQMRTEVSKMLPKGANIFDDAGQINSRLLSEAKDKYPSLFSPGARELTNVYSELWNASKVGSGANEVGTFMNSTAADRLLEPVSGQAEGKISEAVSGSMPRTQPGLTMDEMDSYRAAFGRRANFQGITRDETNDAYARLHHVMSDHLDQKMIDSLTKAGKGQEASQLMGAKDFYSTFKETAEDLQAKVAHDPENAARSLVDVKNPAQVKQLWALLTPEQQGHLSGGYLNTLLDPVIDETTGRMKVATAENQWNKIDPKVKQIMFGDDTAKLDQMINYAKGINLKAPGGYNPQSDGLMSKFMALAHNTNPIKGAMNFISSLFTKNPQAADYVAANLSDVLMPTGADSVSLMKKQRLMERASQGMASRWTRYGAIPAVSADIETDHSAHSIQPGGR